MSRKRRLDPIQAGQELADYIRKRWEAIPPEVNHQLKPAVYGDNDLVSDALEMRWELDFWRSKALGTELP